MKCINCIRAKFGDISHTSDNRFCSCFIKQRNFKKVVAFNDRSPRKAEFLLEKADGPVQKIIDDFIYERSKVDILFFARVAFKQLNRANKRKREEEKIRDPDSNSSSFTDEVINDGEISLI